MSRAPRPRGYYERTGAALDLLGTMRDCDLAAQLGLSAQNITDARRRHGIAASRFYTSGRGHANVDWARIDGRLGTASDVEIARLSGVSVSSVSLRRVMAGIAKYSTASTCACGRSCVATAGGLHRRRYCSPACADAAKHARALRRDANLAVALGALRRELKARTT